MLHLYPYQMNILALNATVGYEDPHFKHLIERRQPMDVVHSRKIDAHHIGALVSEIHDAIESGHTILGSGSDTNTLDESKFNSRSEKVVKMVNIFSYLLIQVRQGKLNINDIKALLICFSEQVFAIALIIVNQISETDLHKIDDLHKFLNSEYEATYFWHQPGAPNFPLTHMDEPRIGEIELASGEREVFVHAQYVRAEALQAIDKFDVKIEDIADGKVVQKFSVGGIKAVQFHPELELDDLKTMLPRFSRDNPFFIGINKALATTQRPRQSTLSKYLKNL